MALLNSLGNEQAMSGAEEIDKLAALRDQGVLTPEEFDGLAERLRTRTTKGVFGPTDLSSGAFYRVRFDQHLPFYWAHPAEGETEADLEGAPRTLVSRPWVRWVELSRLVEWGETGLKLWRSHPRLRGRRVAIELLLAHCRPPKTAAEAKRGWGFEHLYQHGIQFFVVGMTLFFWIYADTHLRDGRIIIAIFTVLAVLCCLGSVRLLRLARLARSLGLVHHTRTLYLANGEEALHETWRTYPTVKRWFAPVLARPYLWLAIGVLLVGGLTMFYQEMDPEMRWKIFGGP